MVPKPHSVCTYFFLRDVKKQVSNRCVYFAEGSTLHFGASLRHIQDSRIWWRISSVRQTSLHTCTRPADRSTAVGLCHMYMEVCMLFYWLAEELIVPLPSNKYPHQYGTQNFITGLSQYWTTINKSVPLHSISLCHILSSATNLCVYFQNSLILLNFLIKVQPAYVYLICFMRTTCPVHPTILDFPTLIKYS